MSGGVDSSLVAMLMKDAGYDCVGCTMKLYLLYDGDIVIGGGTIKAVIQN